MIFRDAWKSVEGTSKEEAQKEYVNVLVKVRLILSIITGSCRGLGVAIFVSVLLFRSKVLSIVYPRSAERAVQQPFWGWMHGALKPRIRTLC